MTLPVYTNQHFTITAANGDTLVGTYDINGEPIPWTSPAEPAASPGRPAPPWSDLPAAEGEWANGFPVNPGTAGGR